MGYSWLTNKQQRLLLVLLSIFPLFLAQIATGETRSNSDSRFCSSILSSKKAGVITEETVSQTNPAIPSLWWAKEQLDPFDGKLIDNWLAYPKQKRIDLVVNWQLWTLLDYLGRYRFVSQFGTVAREYGYNLKIFNQQKKCLATYSYNRDRNPPRWEIKFDPSFQDSLQIQP